MADGLLDYNSGGTQTFGQLQGFPVGTNPMEEFLLGVPGYNFAFDQMQRGIQSNAAASGTLLTGGTLKKLARGGAGVADQHYGDTVNRYLSLADLGLRGATAPFV